jgi:hypothetical protein
MVMKCLVVAAVALSCVSPVAAQTAAEKLELGIFAEETQGDLDRAIQIYEGLVRGAAVSRDIRQVAERRLAAARRRAEAAPAAPSGQTQPPAGPAVPGGGGFWSGNYDQTRPIAVSGIVTGAEWVNPQTVLYVHGWEGNLWGVTLPPPTSMTRAGMTRALYTPGDQLGVDGVRARGQDDGCPAPLPNACGTFPNGALHASIRTITAIDGRTIFDSTRFNRAVEPRTLPAPQR